MVRFPRKKIDDLPRRRRAEVLQRQRDPEPEQSYVFRRNQTLTGSASSRVQALSETNAHIKSPRVHVHALAQKRRYLSLALGGVLLLAGALFGLVSQFTAHSVVSATPDSSIALDSSYTHTIDTYLQSQPAERLRFLMNKPQLEEYVQAAHPEIKSIHTDGAAGLGVSRFVVALREPIAGWDMNSQQQFVDSAGVAFTKNYFTTPAVQIVDNSGIQVTAGQAIASNQFLGFVGQAVGIAKKSNLQVTQVIIPAGTTRQIELKVKGVSYPIRLSVDRSAGEQVEDMVRAIEWMKKNNQSPQYVDVRVSGRAYYR